MAEVLDSHQAELGASAAPSTGAGGLRELAALFLKLGTTAFGGPAVHLAMMEAEVVRRRGWLTRDEFLDLVGATNLIPGPNSTEMAIHIGYRRAGWPGLILAGLCFIVPAMAIVWALAWAYVRYGTRPESAALLYGVKPVVIAVLAQALWSLGRSALKSPLLVMAGALASVLAFASVHELVVLFGTGLAVVVARRGLARARVLPTVVLPALPSLGIAAATASQPVQLATLFWSMVKVGSVLFGSGYVLLAFLRAEFVTRLGWLTEAQLLDALAVGQATPGPVFTTATFVGYVLGGHAGAALATAGIFLPAFVFVAVSSPLLPRLRRSAAAAAFLDGVNVASLALMAVVTLQLGWSAVRDVPTALLALASALLLFRWGTNSSVLVAGGAAAGFLMGRFHGGSPP